MKVSYKWLSQYVDLSGYTAEQLAEMVTRSGIEVDAVERRNKGVSKVVVGHVTAKEKHPEADKLSVCQVDVGDERLQIVCGAANVAAGQNVPVALEGAVLPGGFKIKKAKLRGVESSGMICSAKELGIHERMLPKEQQEGILVLPEYIEPGSDAIDLLSLDDEVLELDLTPNRSDCLSMIGVAYEIGAIIGREVRLPEVQVPEDRSMKSADRFQVKISAKEHCSCYSARLIQDVSIGPSPQWMQNCLIAAGIRPINNVVDITNYVMIEYGQPLHAFDADTVEGGLVEVRLARDGETFVTLDDVERRLEPHMLVIADGLKPIALAGVMGGANTEVSLQTKNVLLEAACFAGGTVRKTSRQLGLRSESSLRFEKEVNAEAVVPALNRAANLIALYASGKPAEGIAEETISEPQPLKLTITADRVNRYLGTSLTLNDINHIFNRLRFATEEREAVLTVHIPARRSDISRDVDLIEEVARLHGYDQIPTSLITGITTPGALTAQQQMRRAIRRLLSGCGLHETVNYSFTHPDQHGSFPGLFASAVPVALAMPMSAERGVLRTSLLPHLLEAAVYNRNRNQNDIAIFEIGSVFVSQEAVLQRLPDEQALLSALWTGNQSNPHWSTKRVPVDFYDLKGVLESLFSFLGIQKFRFKAAAMAELHPGRSAAVYIGEEHIGFIGQLHPDLQYRFDLEDTYVFEIKLNPIYTNAEFAIQYDELPRYPAIERDLAIVLDQSVPVAYIVAAIQESGGELLKSVRVFDVYIGESVGADKKSVALALSFSHMDRTLTDDEVNKQISTIIHKLEHTFTAQLRK